MSKVKIEKGLEVRLVKPLVYCKYWKARTLSQGIVGVLNIVYKIEHVTGPYARLSGGGQMLVVDLREITIQLAQ